MGLPLLAPGVQGPPHLGLLGHVPHVDEVEEEPEEPAKYYLKKISSPSQITWPRSCCGPAGIRSSRQMFAHIQGC